MLLIIIIVSFLMAFFPVVSCELVPKLRLCWIPSYVNIQGNDRTDAVMLHSHQLFANYCYGTSST